MTPIEAKALALVAVSKIEAKGAADQQKRDDMRRSMLTDNEAENMILALMRTRGDRGLTTQEATDALNEIISIRFMHTCIELAMKGLIDIDYDLTQPVNDRLVFRQRKDIDDTLREVVAQRMENGRE